MDGARTGSLAVVGVAFAAFHTAPWYVRSSPAQLGRRVRFHSLAPSSVSVAPGVLVTRVEMSWLGVPPALSGRPMIMLNLMPALESVLMLAHWLGLVA